MIPLDAGDVALYRAITSRVAQGQSYYVAAGSELHRRGYATTPAMNWRLPTLAYIQSTLPSGYWSVGILAALTVATASLWSWSLRERGVLAQTIVATCLLMTGLASLSEPATVFHELWAGVLIAFSLAAAASRFTSLALAAGAVALSIRELSLIYVLLMAAWSLWERRSREAVSWALIAACWVVIYAVHWARASAHTPADALTNAWVTFGGWCFVLATGRANLGLMLMPATAVAVALPALLLGLWRWGPGGHRVAITVSAFVGFFLVAGRPDNWYWGLMIAQLLPLGVVGFFTPNRR